MRPDADDAPTAAELEVLRRRRARLAAPVTAAEAAVTWMAEFPVGGEPHALPLDRLRAAVPLRAVTPLPLARPHVVGILRFEGRPVAAFSLGALLGAGRGWRDDPATLLVLDAGGGRLVAVDCEHVPRPAPLPTARIAGAAWGEGPTADVVDDARRRVTLIDVDRLVARARGLSDPSPARGGAASAWAPGAGEGAHG